MELFTPLYSTEALKAKEDEVIFEVKTSRNNRNLNFIIFYSIYTQNGDT